MISNTILSFDPSLNGYGWAVFINKKLIDCGCIKTTKKSNIRAGESDTSRLTEIATKINELVKQYKPDLLIFEDPAGSKSSRAIQALSLVKGLTIGIAVAYSASLVSLRAKEAKLLICNDSNATKDQILEKVLVLQSNFKSLTDKFTKFETFAASDAVSIGEAYFKKQADMEI